MNLVTKYFHELTSTELYELLKDGIPHVEMQSKMLIAGMDENIHTFISVKLVLLPSVWLIISTINTSMISAMKKVW